MQTNTVILAKKPLIWNPNQIFWGAIIGGFPMGFYLLSKNYKALDKANLAKKSLLMAILSTLILPFAALMIPEDTVKVFVVFILLATGCITTGYMLNEHYKAVYQKDHTLQLVLTMPIVAILLVAAPYAYADKLLPFIPSMMIAIIPALIVNGFAKCYLDDMIKERQLQKDSNYKLIGMSILAVLIQTIVIIAVVVVDSLL